MEKEIWYQGARKEKGFGRRCRGSIGDQNRVCGVCRTRIKLCEVHECLLSTGGCVERKKLKSVFDPLAPLFFNPDWPGAVSETQRTGIHGGFGICHEQEGQAAQHLAGVGAGKVHDQYKETSSHLSRVLLSFFKQKAFLDVDLRTLTYKGDARQSKAGYLF